MHSSRSISCPEATGVCRVNMQSCILQRSAACSRLPAQVSMSQVSTSACHPIHSRPRQRSIPCQAKRDVCTAAAGGSDSANTAVASESTAARGGSDGAAASENNAARRGSDGATVASEAESNSTASQRAKRVSWAPKQTSSWSAKEAGNSDNSQDFLSQLGQNQDYNINITHGKF